MMMMGSSHHTRPRKTHRLSWFFSLSHPSCYFSLLSLSFSLHDISRSRWKSVWDEGEKKLTTSAKYEHGLMMMMAPFIIIGRITHTDRHSGESSHHHFAVTSSLWREKLPRLRVPKGGWSWLRSEDERPSIYRQTWIWHGRVWISPTHRQTDKWWVPWTWFFFFGFYHWKKWWKG